MEDKENYKRYEENGYFEHAYSIPIEWRTSQTNAVDRKNRRDRLQKSLEASEGLPCGMENRFDALYDLRRRRVRLDEVFLRAELRPPLKAFFIA